MRAPTIDEDLRACTAKALDGAALSAQLEAGRFAEIEAAIEVLERAYAADPRCEEPVWMAIAVLNDGPAPALDRWAAARPESWAAFAARGGYWMQAGYESRGRARSRDVSEDAWRDMHQAFERAEPDLQRAMQLRPNAFVPVGYAIRVQRALGGVDQVAAWIEAFVARDPLTCGARTHAIEALAPDWGGSIEAMRRVAEESQAYADRNPRLRILPGYVEAELAMVAWRANDLRTAARHYERALAHGHHWIWNSGLSKVLDKLEDWQGLEHAAGAWIAAWPNDAIGYMWRGRARLKQRRLEDALADLNASFERNPNERYLLSLRGHALEELGRLPEAEAAYELVLGVAPGDAWTIDRLAKLRSRLDAASEGPRRMPGLALIDVEGRPAKRDGE